MNATPTPAGPASKHRLDMICVCGDREHAADPLVAEVVARLSAGGPGLIAREVTEATLITEVVRSLTFDMEPSVSIDGIGCDMWFAVGASTMSGNSARVECDRLEHGFAALWKHFADQQGI